jgi:sRNA-binding regulator protein Hfq
MYKHADTTVYRSEIQRFVKWFDEHQLILNVKKTEKIVFEPKSV